jgi:ribosomal protein S11
MSKLHLFKKEHFYFGENNSAVFVLNTSFSNIFITLIDLKGKVISVRTAGMSHLGNSKRKKLSTQSIDVLVRQFLFYFKIYKIKNVSIILKTKINKFI